jgi:AmmeMemoRadiSam system protein B/AmmeMemoRadiSam system protein A
MEQKKKGAIRRISVLVLILLFCAAVVLYRVFVFEPPTGLNAKTGEAEGGKEMAEEVLQSRLGAMGWYEADADALRAQLGGFFDKAKVEERGNVIGLILPHAGYRYSGQTAAYGAKAIKGKYKRVIVIGPSHRVPMEEVFSVPTVTHYETPLGRVPLDRKFIRKLLGYPVFSNVPYAHESEHSVQIEVPLLQYAQEEFELVPIVAGQCSLETIEKCGAILKSMIDKDTLVVASSDFVHYGPNFGYVPFKENVPAEIKEIDMGAYEYIQKKDCKGFVDYKERTGATICGSVPIAVLLSMMPEPAQAHLMHYTTSGELMDDYSSSVSYLSVVFTGTWEKGQEVQVKQEQQRLTEEDKEKLWVLARKTIEYALEQRKVPQAEDLGIQISESMRQVRGVFVTLHKRPEGSVGPARGQLRGCIGDIFPQQPLYKSVIENSVNAAFRDRRFQPVAKEEMEDITIEISALTVPAPVDTAEAIRIGTDGVVMRKEGRSAVFLPQVATEQGWDLETMLTQLSLKAGLGGDDWKEDASFLVFQAEIFGEEE